MAGFFYIGNVRVAIGKYTPTLITHLSVLTPTRGLQPADAPQFIRGYIGGAENTETRTKAPE